MKKVVTWLFVGLLLSGCAGSATQQAINQFTPSMENEYHFVVFYESEPPNDEYQSSLKGIQVFLARKNIQSQVTYQKIDTGEKDYHDLLQVQDQQILVFNHQGIRFNARNVKVLEGMILQLTN